MKSDILNNKDIIEEILTSDPRTRNDDMLLIWSVWKRLYPQIHVPYAVLHLLPKAESIRRTRQKFQERCR